MYGSKHENRIFKDYGNILQIDVDVKLLSAIAIYTE